MLESENIKQSIAQSFFENLEFHLSGALKNSADKALHWFWCDGIMPPEDMTQLCPENLHKTRRIIAKAWIGQSGQDIYDLYINLGRLPCKIVLNSPIGMIACHPTIPRIGLRFHPKKDGLNYV